MKTFSPIRHQHLLRPFFNPLKTTTIVDDNIPRILTFWLGPPAAPHSYDRWFRPDPTIDDQIRSEFGSLVLEARNANSPLDPWAETAKGALALIILLDQFPRNIYRGSADAFASDQKARDVSVRAISSGFDEQVEPVSEGLFYLQ